MKNVLRRVDLSRETGCNIETIRYYEKIGILPAPPRGENGYRQYDQAHVDRLRFVMRSRELGFTLDEIRSLLGLVDRGAQSCAEVQAVAQGHLETVRARIRDLRRVEKVLSETVSRCSGRDVPECPVMDALAG